MSFKVNSEDAKYKSGDVVIINSKEWIVESLTMKYGIQSTYTLKNDNGGSIQIETGSLERMLNY
tara:strand:+ start:757 stop:948 length:192 start_codon:yes stop_codon:yes gene_type:complete